MTALSAIICAYGPEPYLADCVAALRNSRGVDVEVIVVDNGSPDCAGLPEDVRVISPGENTGFAGGCNLGAEAARGSILAFINSDAVVEPDCLAMLHDALRNPGAGLVGATILLADEPEVVNSWGNPVHVLGFSWAGGYGHPVDQAVTGERASVSGAVFAVRRESFRRLFGLDEQYFAYGEDVDLSLRTWLQGLTVTVISDARAAHHYDFSRNPDKMYLLERNRLITVLSTYQWRTLAALGPLILASEAAMMLRSVREGWAGQKLAGWRWLVANRRYLRRRRNRLQGVRRTDDAFLLGRLSLELDPPERFGVQVSPAMKSLTQAYWRGFGARVAGL